MVIAAPAPAYASTDPASPAPIASALDAARELARRVGSMAAHASAARHPSYAIAHALTLTLLDMLEEAGRESR